MEESTTAPAGIDWQGVIDTVVDWVMHTGIKIIIALIILFVSFRIINVVTRKITKRMVEGKRKIDKTLATTLMYILKIVLKVVVVMCLIGFLGIDTSGLTAVVTSLGVCAGLAVNGALSNFCGGVVILITRPFRVDDYIEAAGEAGTVEDIRMTCTRLRTPDNKVIYVPNGTLSTSTIINYSEKDVRRVDMTFSIGYADDFEQAKATVLEICNAHGLVLKDPAPFVRVSEHGASSINLVCRVWVNNGDYWTVYYDILETVKKKFDEMGIEIPYNQLDVHVKNG